MKSCPVTRWMTALLCSLLITGPAAAAEPDCIKVAEVCAEPGGTRVIDGMPVTQECWRKTSTYECRSPSMSSNCQPLRDRGCEQTGSDCISPSPDGSCALYEQRYRCPLTPARTESRTVCQRALCLTQGSGCFDTSAPADRDLGRVAAALEAQREAGIYGVDPQGIELFEGHAEACSIKVLGGSSIKSCCSAEAGGSRYTNYEVIGLTAKAAWAVAKEEVQAGSKYVYDALFMGQDASLMQQGGAAAAGGLGDLAAGSAQTGSTFGAYGFEFSYSAAGGFEFVAFDPTTFALAVMMAIITEWLQCEPPEQVLQLKRGQNLCAQVGTRCVTRALGVCVEQRQTHCCFNSVLARLINRQGRAQLGLDLQLCDGFTQEEFSRLDFARFDFSEFMATIQPREADAQASTQAVSGTVQERVRNYFGGP